MSLLAESGTSHSKASAKLTSPDVFVNTPSFQDSSSENSTNSSSHIPVHFDISFDVEGASFPLDSFAFLEYQLIMAHQVLHIHRAKKVDLFVCTRETDALYTRNYVSGLQPHAIYRCALLLQFVPPSNSTKPCSNPSHPGHQA